MAQHQTKNGLTSRVCWINVLVEMDFRGQIMTSKVDSRAERLILIHHALVLFVSIPVNTNTDPMLPQC